MSVMSEVRGGVFSSSIKSISLESDQTRGFLYVLLLRGGMLKVRGLLYFWKFDIPLRLEKGWNVHL